MTPSPSGGHAEQHETDVADGPPDRDGLLAEQLLRLTRRLHRIQKQNLEPLGITPAQGRLLRAVAGFGRPPRMADLARRLEVVPRAITSLVDGLETGGRVRRVPDPDSRRVTRIELTDSGRDALNRLRGARRGAAEDVLAPLTAQQRDQFSQLLARLVPEGEHSHEVRPDADAPSPEPRGDSGG
ncbi:MarR family winged helix-turn-helix transcriptional regulator [Streptomyces sp. NPDC007088]|uniref:MarR family winged helix-turn-helix transcriptional regulator n=1 Tax=Streptomyces sp. NPDC007088 TaxID=3364773 RepID=UPI0036A3A3FF